MEPLKQRATRLAIRVLGKALLNPRDRATPAVILAEFEQIRTEALEDAALLVEERGRKVRGAIDPDITAKAIRELGVGEKGLGG